MKPAPRRDPALDGLRGFALVGMLMWHAEVAWIDGGFARMTIFFSLSGYLATRSWVRRREAEGSFLAFWRRRTVRLLPVTLFGVAVAVSVTAAVGSAATRASVRGDTVSVLTYLSNWRFVSQDVEYGALFERDSAFQHFWSLSIEEQCFVLLPLVLAGAFLAARRLRRSPAIPVAALALALAAVPVVVDHTPDQAYFGTHVRMAEFLAGAWLALVLDRERVLVSQAVAGAVRWAGRVSLGGLAAVMLTVPRDADWLYEGGLTIFAIPAVATIAAIVVGDRALSRVLGIAPLRLLGRWALSVYVLHWPLYILLEARWPAAADRWLVPVQLGAAVAVGAAVHYALERPLLPADSTVGGERRWVVPTPSVRVMAAVGGVIALAAVAVPARSPTYDFAAAQAAFQGARAEEAPLDDSAAPEVRRIGLYGGSTAVMLGLGMPRWAESDPSIEDARGWGDLGCGLLVDGERALIQDGRRQWLAVPDVCRTYLNEWTRSTVERDVRIALLVVGHWEAVDWRVPGLPGVVHAGEPAFDTRTREQLEVAMGALRASGVERVILWTTPVIGPGTDGRAAARFGAPPDHEDRVAAVNDVLREVAAENPDVEVFEYAAFLSALDPATDARIRPDGIHPTVDTSIELWTELGLGAALRTLLDHP